MQKEYKGRKIEIEVHPLGRRWAWSYSIEGHDVHRIEEAPAAYEHVAVDQAYAAACGMIDRDLY